MIRRPKPGEDEDDILKMQEEFLRDKNAQPAAQVVNLRKTEHQTTKRTNANETRKPSKYAQSKGLGGKRSRTENDTGSGSVMGNILEKNVIELDEKPPEPEDDKVYFPQILPSILGDIVEKNTDDVATIDFKPMPEKGFPEVMRRNFNIKPTVKNVTTSDKSNTRETMDIDLPSGSKLQEIPDSKPINIPAKSYIVSSNDANAIHSENVKVLSEMSEQDILKEQQKLLSTIDPKLIEFIKKKRQEKLTTSLETKAQKVISAKMDVDSTHNVIENDSLWENDVLSHPQINKWVNFTDLEKDKLEWMKGISESKAITDKPYEARFDFNGYLLPYTMEYTDKTKTLFHHGEEPHRPGYTIMELIELSRSTIIQQRATSLNTIAGVLEYNSTGIYKDIIDIPLSKLFFVIRIAMDENKIILLEPALKAMRNLLFNKIDEACLDALIGFEEGAYQPSLENDKSEIEEMESKESELKDFHLAEIDLIAAILRTDILQRLYYILEFVRPSFNCVQYALQILTRLVRDSVDTAGKIVENEHLMTTIVTNFVPNTSINFSFDPNIVYNGKPILAALKLLRILSLQSRDIGDSLIKKYNILKPVSEYISSGVDGTYGLRLQIESFCILTNLLSYDLGVEDAISLCPIIVNTLYKHVQGTDIYFVSSIISVTHAAVLLQFVNKLLNCNMLNIENYKHQIYPLLKDGVQKWLSQTASLDNYTSGHLRLVCSALDCCKTIIINEKVTLKFLNDALKNLSKSVGFNIIVNNLVLSSNLLSNIEDKDLNYTKNLVCLGGSVIDTSQKVLPILNVATPVPFMVSLFKLLNMVNEKDVSLIFINSVLNYLEKISKTPPSLSSNWFTRMEVELVFSIVKLAKQSDVSESLKDLIYIVASKLCYILRADKRFELEYLFNYIIFNKEWFTAERLLNLVSLSEADGFSKALTTVDDIKMCYIKVVNVSRMQIIGNIVLKQWQEPVLPRDWIYLPILSLYSKSQEVTTTPDVVGDQANLLNQKQAEEKELIIRCSLEWILFNEICFPDLLKDIDVTDRYCRIMCVFLSDNSLFLDEKIKIILKKCTGILFKHRNKFNFDKQLTGLNNFQDLYTQFLEQFQSVSYGDPTFAACVLVPLAQRHNVKWRKLLWSEYAGCLRALDCPDSYMCYDLNEYLHPDETDESLLKSYFRALSSNLLRPGTVAHKIAQHHVDSFKKRQNLVK